MSDERWRQIKHIAHEALLLDAADRSRFLDEACADPQTRREVESLLSHESDSFLETPPPLSQDTPSVLQAGARLGQFEIIAPLGAGGMGEVFRARDYELGRDVAIKVLPPSFSHDRDRLARFAREARAVAALDHPNVVTLHSVEHEGGIHFLTMQLVQGQTLSELLPEHGLPLDRFFALAIPLLDAVCAAHRRGIMHRDLKPGNVMVGADDRLRVLDFGLAKMLDEPPADDAEDLPTQHLTGRGRVLGTVAYMSPEQAEGRRIDPRSDVFSLGVLLYEMVTGQRPFQGRTPVSIITSILRDEPPRIAELRPDAPRHLSRIIKRSLAKRPGRRYQTAIDLRNELQELQRELGARASPGAQPQVATRARRPRAATPMPEPQGSVSAPGSGSVSTDSEVIVDLIRRRLWPLLIASGALVSLLVLGYRMLPNPAPVIELKTTRLTSMEGPELGVSWSPDAGFIAVSHVLAGNADILLRPTAGGASILFATSPLDEIRPSWSPASGRPSVAYLKRASEGLAIYRAEPFGGAHQELASTGVHPYSGIAPEHLVGASPWSPDGNSFFFSRFDPRSRAVAIHRVELVSSRSLQLTYPEPGVHDYRASSSPDGRRVIFERVGANGLQGLWLIDAGGGEPQPVWQDAFAPSGPDWLDDDTLVFSSLRDGTPGLWVVDIDDPDSLRPLTVGAGVEVDPVVAADGRIAYSSFSHHTDLLWLPVDGIDAEPAKLTAEAPGSDSFGARINPDGDRIVYHSNRLDPDNSDLWLISRRSPRPERLTTEPAQEILPDWSPSGNEVVYLSNQEGPYQLWTLDVESRASRRLTDQEVLVWRVGAAHSQGPRWAPDGAVIGYLAQTDGAPDLWTVSPEGTDARRRLSGVLSFGWYRDGEHVIYAREPPVEGAGIELWAANLANGTQTRLLDVAVGEIAVAADGSALSYLSAVSHFTDRLMVQKLERNPVTGLPRRVADPRAVPARGGAWHIHNGGWAWDGSAVIYTRDTDQGDIWVLTQR